MKDAAEWEEEARCEDGEGEDDRRGGVEPTWPVEAVDGEKEEVADDCEPVESGVRAIGGGAPAGCAADAKEGDGEDCGEDHETARVRTEAAPDLSKEKKCCRDESEEEKR